MLKITSFSPLYSPTATFRPHLRLENKSVSQLSMIGRRIFEQPKFSSTNPLARMTLSPLRNKLGSTGTAMSFDWLLVAAGVLGLSILNGSSSSNEVHAESQFQTAMGTGNKQVSQGDGSVNAENIYINHYTEPKEIPRQINSPPIETHQIFLGRESELNKINEVFHSPNQPEEVRICVLRATGGRGKTQLALNYIKQHDKEYNRLIYINCANEAKLVTSLKGIAEAYGYRVTSDDLYGLTEHLLNKEENYLLFIDNVDSEEILEKIKIIIPKEPIAQKPGHILITARYDLAALKTGELSGSTEVIQIKPLEKEAARAVFESYVKDKPTRWEALLKEPNREKFFLTLKGEPVLICVLARTYANDDECSLQDLEKRKKSIDPVVMSTLLGIKDEGISYATCILEACNFSIESIESKFIQGSPGRPMVRDVLRFLAFYGECEDISIRFETVDDLKEVFASVTGLQDYQPHVTKNEEFKNLFRMVLSKLSRYALIEGDHESGRILLPDPVRYAVQYQYITSPDIKTQLDNVDKEIKDCNESGRLYRAWSRAKSFILPDPRRTYEPKEYQNIRNYDKDVIKYKWFIKICEYRNKEPFEVNLQDDYISDVIGFLDFLHSRSDSVSPLFKIDVILEQKKLWNVIQKSDYGTKISSLSSEKISKLHDLCASLLDECDPEKHKEYSQIQKHSQKLHRFCYLIAKWYLKNDDTSLIDMDQVKIYAKLLDASSETNYFFKRDISDFRFVAGMTCLRKSLQYAPSQRESLIREAISFLSKSESTYYAKMAASLCYKLLGDNGKADSEEKSAYTYKILPNKDSDDQDRQDPNDVPWNERFKKTFSAIAENLLLYSHDSMAIFIYNKCIEVDVEDDKYWLRLSDLYADKNIRQGLRALVRLGSTSSDSTYREILSSTYWKIVSSTYRKIVSKFLNEKVGFTQEQYFPDHGLLFAKIINANSSITSIKLEKGDLNWDALLCIGDSLKNNTTLSTLALSVDKSVTDAEIRFMMDSLTKNEHLSELCLKGNSNITEESIRLLIALAPKQLKKVTTSNFAKMSDGTLESLDRLAREKGVTWSDPQLTQYLAKKAKEK